MTKLNLVFTLSEVDDFDRKFVADHEVVIDAPELDTEDLYQSLIDNLVDFDAAARKKLAATRVDYDAFSSDSDYLQRLDEVAEYFYTADVYVGGAVRKGYLVDGEYGSEGLWSDVMDGVNEGEAKFQALWTMAENCSGSFESRIAGLSPQKFIDSHLESMDYNAVHDVAIDGVRPDEVLTVLRKLCDAVEGTMASNPAYEEARALLKKNNDVLKARAVDEIEYLEDEVEAASGPRL